MTHAVGQAEAVGDGQHHAQKQRQQYGLNGEHENVLDHAGDDHGEGVLFAVHVKGIIPHHDGGLEQHIDDQTDGKPAEHDPGGGDLCPVQEQGENQGAADFRQDKGQEVHALRTDDVTQHVRDAGGQHGHHGAKDHSAQRIDEKRGIDLQEGRNGDGDLLHNQTQGDHERREYQHVGVLQLGGSVTPVGFGKRMGIQGIALL